MSFVRVTANYGADRNAEGVYEDSGGIFSKGLYRFVFDGLDTWSLQLDEVEFESSSPDGDNSSPSSATWQSYRVEVISSPGEIPGAGAVVPSSPGQLPATEGGNVVVTSPGSVNPQGAGVPSSPGAVNPVAPGVPDQPENYVGTFAQTLPGSRKERARQNIGAVGPINVLVIAQSNLANGRAGGDIAFNPDVKIWVDASNDNAATSGFQSWDLSLQPPQHSWPDLVADIGNNMPGANRNKWSHALAKKLQRVTSRPVHIAQAAQSGVPLQHWITTANGGEQEIWDYLVQATTDAGITRYDYIFYDHGESGVGAEMGGTYENATRLLRDQLEAAGYIDDATVFLAREISTGATTAAIETVWITERNGNGRIYPNDDFVYDGDGIHITGEEQDDVANGHFDWLFQKGVFATSDVVNFETAKLTALIPDDAFVIFDDDGTSKKIPAKAFFLETSGTPYPATPDAVFYGENYVEGDEEIVAGGTTLTMEPGDTEPTVDTETAALVFTASDSQFNAPAAILSNTGDWLVAMRVRFTGSTAQQRTLFEQFDSGAGDSAERTYLRYNTGGTLRFRCGGSTEVDSTTGDTFGINEWFTILVQRDGDTINVIVNGTTYSDSGVSLLVQQQPFVFGTGVMGPLRGDLRKLIVYDRAVTSDEIAEVTAWLDSL